jgi:hypothetical protein
MSSLGMNTIDFRLERQAARDLRMKRVHAVLPALLENTAALCAAVPPDASPADRIAAAATGFIAALGAPGSLLFQTCVYIGVLEGGSIRFVAATPNCSPKLRAPDTATVVLAGTQVLAGVVGSKAPSEVLPHTHATLVNIGDGPARPLAGFYRAWPILSQTGDVLGVVCADTFASNPLDAPETLRMPEEEAVFAPDTFNVTNRLPTGDAVALTAPVQEALDQVARMLGNMIA